VFLAVVAAAFIARLPERITPARNRMPLTSCENNLKQIGLALNDFAADYGGRFPPQVSVTNEGAMELNGSGSPVASFKWEARRKIGMKLTA